MSLDVMAADGISPRMLFEAVGLEPAGSVTWGEVVPSESSGVYVISLHSDPQVGAGLPSPPLDREVAIEWLRCCPGLTLRDERVDVDALLSHLGGWWLTNTPVLYIGKASGQSLRKRVGQYYTTPLGARRPHGGGYWLKVLSVLPSLRVHYVEIPGASGQGAPLVQRAEDDLLNAFLRHYGEPSQGHPEPMLALPWANLEIVRPAPRRRRHHGLPSLASQDFRCG